MTLDEMKALPEGPAFGSIIKVINGETVHVPVAPDVVAYFVEPDQLQSWTDETGSWMLGRYRDGSWFRKRMA